MAATVQVSVQKIDINPVTDIVVTPIARDSNGLFVRAIRFLGKADDGSGQTLLLEVVVRGAAATDVDIPVPATSF